jgi:hypothetical protein
MHTLTIGTYCSGGIDGFADAAQNIIRICKQIIAERTTSDTKLYLLNGHLSEEYNLYLPKDKLAEIVSICERIE